MSTMTDFIEMKRDFLARHDRQVGPDVATASRATLGGMLGNNSAGSRSIVYGKTADHTCRLSAILADGSQTEFGPVTAKQWQQLETRRGLEATIYRRTR